MYTRHVSRGVVGAAHSVLKTSNDFWDGLLTSTALATGVDVKYLPEPAAPGLLSVTVPLAFTVPFTPLFTTPPDDGRLIVSFPNVSTSPLMDTLWAIDK